MSNATFTFGRFNPPTEEGHGKLVSAVQSHAEETGGKHYIFPSRTQDKKKNPMTHEDKVGAMRKLFPKANVVSHKDVHTAIDAMKHLESKGHTHVTMVVGSDRVDEFHKLLNKYRTKEFPKVKKVNVISAGHRDPDAEGAEGMSASKLRGLVSSGKKKEFVSHYSDPKLGAHIHDKVKAGMQMESATPIGIFLLGGPGSGKDYVLNNIFSRFDLTEVQADQILAGSFVSENKNIVINGAVDSDKIEIIKNLLEGYDFDYVHVSVSNKISRIRNLMRANPLPENKRIEKWLKAEKLAETYDCFKFNNSINLNESSQMEQLVFGSQIEKLLERITAHGLPLVEKEFPAIKKDKESGLPKKYVAGLSKSTAKARAAHWKEKAKLSDSDPRAYEPAPGDATAKTKPSKYTKKYHAMYGEEVELDEGAADTSLAAKSKKSGISVGTLRKVYNRGVAAWNSGHRPGTTPQQWGHARVNSYITKGKTYHTADKDLHEASVQKVEGTNCGNCVYWCKDSEQKVDKSELNENGGLKAPNQAYLDKSKHADLISLPGKGTADVKAICEHPDIKDFVTDRMCCSYWNGEGTKREYKGTSPKLDEDFDKFISSDDCGCEESTGIKTFSQFKEATEVVQTADLTPDLKTNKKKSRAVPPTDYRSTLAGMPVVTAKMNEEEDDYEFQAMVQRLKKKAQQQRELEAKGQKPVTKYNEKTGKYHVDFAAKKEMEESVSLEEAVQFHVENKVSFTENIFRPGSDMFFSMINEAKRLYKEGKYTPADEYEKQMLESDIGEKAMFEGKEVILDFPFEVEQIEEGRAWTHEDEYIRHMDAYGDAMVKNNYSKAEMHAKKAEDAAAKHFKTTGEKIKDPRYTGKSPHIVNEDSDPTNGHGIGKPFRKGGGGAVYVKSGDSVRLVNFSQSGMKKKFMDPGATRSFVARHHCLTNSDKTSASYWACRWPRYFSNSGKTWW